MNNHIGVATAGGVRRSNAEGPQVNRHAFVLHLLGGFQVARGDTVIEVAHSSQRLLGFLALQDRALPRSFVAANLWPDTTDCKAAANLRTALWRLRQPNVDLIAVRGDRLSLRQDVWCDVRALRDASRRHRVDGSLPHDELLTEARGELLPGCWDSWIAFERERLRQEVAYLCEEACTAHVVAGDYHRALLLALAAVENDPLRESANLAVIRVHLVAGNRTAAIRHARGYAALLADDLGIEPPEAVDELLWNRPVDVPLDVTLSA
jgi:DNA-binding SARP family transcriptional activator